MSKFELMTRIKYDSYNELLKVEKPAIGTICFVIDENNYYMYDGEQYILYKKEEQFDLFDLGLPIFIGDYDKGISSFPEIGIKGTFYLLPIDKNNEFYQRFIWLDKMYEIVDTVGREVLNNHEEYIISGS